MANDSKSLNYVSVALEGTALKPLDYAIPPAFQGKISKGMAVDVPVRGSVRRAYVLDLKAESAFEKVLPIHDIACDGKELIGEELFELAIWMAKYYCCSLGPVLRAMLPAGVRKSVEQKTQLEVRRLKSRDELVAAILLIRPSAPNQALVLEAMLKVRKNIFLSELIEQTGCARSSIDALVTKGFLELKKLAGGLLEEHEYFRSAPKKLGKEQQEALNKILDSLGSYKTHLLYGVTGSGKTEVYLQAIEECLNRGLSALVLVPEIALTTQTYERFRSRFDHKIALLHHRLSDGERSNTWSAIRSGEIRIVLGARSAIFSPMKNLGLIIVDEEHEPSYKQTDDSPSYHARDVAIMRGFFAKAPVILGSATPSLESYFNAQQGKYELSILKARQGSGLMASVELIDMKRAMDRGSSLFSDELISAIKERLILGEQTIIFLNRRGYHTTQLCTSCAHVIECPHCDVSMAFHHNENTLSCHSCGFQSKPSIT
ncbi:MAG: primosomal protein N', partial [Chlamydiota bacterium]